MYKSILFTSHIQIKNNNTKRKKEKEEKESCFRLKD